jgi:hypothetical protein
VLADLFAVIAPIFVAAGIGFAWIKIGRPYPAQFVTMLVVEVGTPCLVFDALTRHEVGAAAIAELALAMALAHAGFAALGAAALRLTGLPLPHYLPALMFPNVGNMGLPLALFAFGQAGLGLAIACFAVAAVAQFTVGQWIAAGRSGAGMLLRTPLLYAVAVSVAVIGLDLEPPRWLANTVQLIAGLTVPLMLITLGVALAELKLTAARRSLVLSLLRLVMGFGVGWGLAEALGLAGTARGVLILECAMPVAVFNYLFAQRYSRAPAEVASMVLVSTALSFATLPLLLYFAMGEAAR